MESSGNGDNKKLKNFILEFSDGVTRVRQQRTIQALTLSHAKDILWYENPDAFNIMDVTEDEITQSQPKPNNIIDTEAKFGGSSNNQ